MARHIKNPYPVFSSETKNMYLESDHINDKTRSKIESLEEKLLAVIQDETKIVGGKNDYSIYTGYCGIAYLHLMKYMQTKHDRYLDAGIQFADKAVSTLKNERISFLTGDSGPLALNAVFYKLKGDEKLTNEHIARLLEINFKSSSYPDEVLYGRAGYLYSLMFVEKYCPNAIPTQHYKKVIQSIIESGRKLAKRISSVAPLSYAWHGKNYLGAAHGVAGILYMLLLKVELLTDEELKDIKLTLDWLVDQKYPSSNPKSSEESDRDRLVQWCHGAPGFVQLYLLASKVFKEEKYKLLAEGLGDIVWERGVLKKGYSICHGTSGNAYTFLALYKVTKQEKQLYRAACFADYCATWPDHQELVPDRHISLFEGIAGIAYFCNDLREPLNSCFPAYEI